MNEVERSLREQLSQTQQEHHTATEQIQQLQTALAQALEQVAASHEQLHTATLRRNLLEQRLIKTRASMTYRLGYELKEGTRSLSGWVRLPAVLFKLFRQACKHRALIQANACVEPAPLPAVAPTNRATPAPRPLENASYLRNHLLTGANDSSKGLKVACVMDDFSYEAYRHECQLLPLTPANSLAELQAFQPELLFIESAWCGKDALWKNKVGHNSEELRGVLKWCKEHRVPTVFWNKEDPVHFETFLSTAKQFDFVFTTDFDCIHRYKGALGHDRAYLLPFACQPALHNPIELYQRKDAFCFAGAYYVRYPERTRDLDNFLRDLPQFRPLDIFDRNLEKQDPNYQFPAAYRPYIVGTLGTAHMDLAYKGYRYGVNLNSIKHSQSMFARRIFELLGSNTLTVSNFSRGLRLLFGDLVITTDNSAQAVHRLKMLADNPQNSAKLRLAGLRKVMQEHTYAHRLSYVMAKVHGSAMHDTLPSICLLARATDDSQFQALGRHLQRQRYANVVMHVWVSDTVQVQACTLPPRLCVHRHPQPDTLTIRELANGAPWFGTMLAEDYYGANYLLDLALAAGYSQAVVVGKVTHYAAASSGIHLHNANQEYRCASAIAARCSLIKTAAVAEQIAGDWLNTSQTLEYRNTQGLATDAFNYCRGAASLNEQHVSETVDDLQVTIGLRLDQLLRRAEAIPALKTNTRSAHLSGQALAQQFGPPSSRLMQDRIDGDIWHIRSSLADGKHQYWYARQELSVAQLGGAPLKLCLDATPGLNIQLVVLFLDAHKQRIGHSMAPANRNQTCDIPPETAYLRLGIRVYGSGSAGITALLLGHRDLQPPTLLAKARHLLLTNHYPAYEDLYRNGFVHTRVCAYQARGIAIDVFRLRANDTARYQEFENVDVMSGSPATLATMLDSGSYNVVLVHFLDPSMWEVLHQYTQNIRIIVWVHGAEIQPWWRRAYNCSNDEQLQLAKLDSEKRMHFWRNLLAPMPANLKLVFVSRHFAEEVMEDLGFRLPDEQYEIIHNPIDTQLFSHAEKPVEQRRKILSIRPYASAKYANDLSVRAIELLALKPYFAQLEFHLVGDGALFEETLGPLRKYPNVKIERRFLRQQEIAALHKHYGIFLCPSRMDAQGVSRDEAMASGLVPVTSRVAAIPEFVNERCAILAPAEDANALAAGIARLVENPQLFRELSAAARARVERQTSMSRVIAQEISLIDV
ncbi:MAG: glycosyltransferase family protein [Pseudomonas proteolytica]|uniref:glycosyltransferase family protein n=1 Tax=Pseudomonas proteolytica TaxID=219574 RepID=UPI003F340941